MSGRYDTGGSYQPLSPNFANFQVLAAPPANPGIGRSYFNTTLGVGVYANSIWNYASGGAGAITSVFGRTGIVVAASGDYTFAQIGSIPTTLAGYTITDGVSLTGVQTLTNKTISGASNTITSIAESSVTNLTSDLAAKQATLSLTTTGTSGAATLVGATLNVPNYATSGGTPGGSTTQVQYNNAGAFGGITGATTNGTALTLVAPVLGTPASGTLTNCTGLPISAGVSGLGAGISTFLATPSSANLATAVTDETGSGSLVFATSPTLVTPTLGVATVSSVNNIVLTNPGSSATLTLANGSTLVTSGAFSITLISTAGTSITLPTTGTLYGTAAASITSAQLGTSLSDKTGTGVNVFATTPTLVTPVLGVATATSLNGLIVTTTTGTLTLVNGSTLATSGANSITLTSTGTTNVTLPTSGTLLTANQTVTLSGDISGSGATAITTVIGANKVTLGMHSTLVASSVIGNSTNATATPTAVSVPLIMASGTASAQATLDINLSSYTAQFSMIEIQLTNVVPATNAAILEARLSTDGTTFAATGYKWNFTYAVAAAPGGQDDAGASDTTTIHLTGSSSSTATQAIQVNLRIANPNSTSFFPNVQFVSTRYNDSPATAVAIGFGTITTAQATKGIRLLFSSGNITTATYRVIGYV